MELQLDLPFELGPYREKIMASLRPFVRILPQAATETKPWQSKIGGLPYQPLGAELPMGSAGRPLALLAQINFAEMSGLEAFPERGLLQFFIGNDWDYGMNADELANQRNFRVRYFEEVLEDSDSLRSDLVVTETEGFPFDPALSYPLEFELAQEVVPLTDHRILGFLDDDVFARFGRRKWDVMEAYSKAVHAGGHKLGGYGFFAQEDPRTDDNVPTELLLQIDSDQALGIQWGDMGTAHFFIDKNMLEKRDFSKVAFHWDSY